MGYFSTRRVMELAALDQPWIGELLMRKRFRKPEPARAEDWNSDYSGTKYHRLFRSEQRHHHRLLAGLINDHSRFPRVLEIGCGEGAFYESISGFNIQSYLGVDFSDVGIESARASYEGKSLPGDPRFVVGDGARFEANAKFDVIAFPEVIEYLGDPVAALSHYESSLAKGGVFAITTWMNTKALRTWRRIKTAYRPLDEAVVHAPWGGAWVVGVVQRNPLA